MKLRWALKPRADRLPPERDNWLGPICRVFGPGIHEQRMFPPVAATGASVRWPHCLLQAFRPHTYIWKWSWHQTCGPEHVDPAAAVAYP